MTIRMLCVAAALLLPASAFGQIYVSAQGGASFLEASDNTADGINVRSTFDPGYQFALKVGGTLERHWRVEGEVGYARNNVDELQFSTYSSSGRGNKSAIKGLVNVLYVFVPQRRLHPYAGVGLGAAYLTIDNIRVNGVTFAGDTDTEFAYQAIAGLEYALTQSASLYLSYHYFATTPPTFNDVYADKPYRSEYRSNNVSVGLRYAFP